MSDNLRVCWECPSNIALVKYWGKRPGQLPVNPSLSFTLSRSVSRTFVSLVSKGREKLQFLFEGKPSPFEERVKNYLDVLTAKLPWIGDYGFVMESSNTFPHSAGIASSASAFGALALCLAELDDRLHHRTGPDTGFFGRASALARIGSGSACRSVYPGFAWWGEAPEVAGSSDEYAIPVSASPHYKGLRDAVLLIDSAKKDVSSSAGHELMNRHPYRDGRIAQAAENARELLHLLQTGHFGRFFELAEQEAFSLHALMMSSSPAFLLLKPASLKVIEKIRAFRTETGLPVGLTIDAGPNIHFLYFENDREEVHRFIDLELASLLEEGKWLDDGIGSGPVRIK